jgi:hypothetical protein
MGTERRAQVRPTLFNTSKIGAMNRTSGQPKAQGQAEPITQYFFKKPTTANSIVRYRYTIINRHLQEREVSR